MSAFTDHVAITPSDDLERRWMLTEPLGWDLLKKDSGLTITVPAGYLSDLVTVPALARVFVDVTSPSLVKAAILHDWLLDDLRISRLEAAAVFHDALRAGGGAPIRTALAAVCVWVWTEWLGPRITGRTERPR